MRIEQILEHLDKVKSSGANKWAACCPAHDDKSPSLALTETSDGRILLHCFAGCGGAEILHAIGLTLADLYPDGPTGNWYSFGYHQEKSRDKRLHLERTILELARDDRMNGRRLSLADLKKEQDAFLKTRAIQ